MFSGMSERFNTDLFQVELIDTILVHAVIPILIVAYSLIYLTRDKKASNFSKLLPTASKCFPILQNASKCLKMLQNASKCLKMLQNASKCLKKMLQKNASKRSNGELNGAKWSKFEQTEAN